MSTLNLATGPDTCCRFCRHTSCAALISRDFFILFDTRSVPVLPCYCATLAYPRFTLFGGARLVWCADTQNDLQRQCFNLRKQQKLLRCLGPPGFASYVLNLQITCTAGPLQRTRLLPPQYCKSCSIPRRLLRQRLWIEASLTPTSSSALEI